MCPEVCITPLVAFIVNCCIRSLGGMAHHLALGSFNSPLRLYDGLLRCCHDGVLGVHVIGVFCDLIFQVYVGTSEVSQ